MKREFDGTRWHRADLSLYDRYSSSELFCVPYCAWSAPSMRFGLILNGPVYIDPRTFLRVDIVNVRMRTSKGNMRRSLVLTGRERYGTVRRLEIPRALLGWIGDHYDKII